jgi:hypothetical protein
MVKPAQWANNRSPLWPAAQFGQPSVGHSQIGKDSEPEQHKRCNQEHEKTIPATAAQRVLSGSAL